MVSVAESLLGEALPPPSLFGSSIHSSLDPGVLPLHELPLASYRPFIPCRTLSLVSSNAFGLTSSPSHYSHSFILGPISVCLAMGTFNPYGEKIDLPKQRDLELKFGLDKTDLNSFRDTLKAFRESYKTDRDMPDGDYVHDCSIMEHKEILESMTSTFLQKYRQTFWSSCKDQEIDCKGGWVDPLSLTFLHLTFR